MDIWNSNVVLTILIAAGVIWSLFGLVKRFARHPTYDEDLGRWRDDQGRFISDWTAATGLMSIAAPIAFFALRYSQSCPELFINWMDTLLGYVTDNFGISAGIAMIVDGAGYLLNQLN